MYPIHSIGEGWIPRFFGDMRETYVSRPILCIGYIGLYYVLDSHEDLYYV
jgi:hypothetical protein